MRTRVFVYVFVLLFPYTIADPFWSENVKIISNPVQHTIEAYYDAEQLPDHVVEMAIFWWPYKNASDNVLDVDVVKTRSIQTQCNQTLPLLNEPLAIFEIHDRSCFSDGHEYGLSPPAPGDTNEEPDDPSIMSNVNDVPLGHKHYGDVNHDHTHGDPHVHETSVHDHADDPLSVEHRHHAHTSDSHSSTEWITDAYELVKTYDVFGRQKTLVQALSVADGVFTDHKKAYADAYYDYFFKHVQTDQELWRALKNAIGVTEAYDAFDDFAPETFHPLKTKTEQLLEETLAATDRTILKTAIDAHFQTIKDEVSPPGSGKTSDEILDAIKTKGKDLYPKLKAITTDDDLDTLRDEEHTKLGLLTSSIDYSKIQKEVDATYVQLAALVLRHERQHDGAPEPYTRRYYADKLLLSEDGTASSAAVNDFRWGDANPTPSTLSIAIAAYYVNEFHPDPNAAKAIAATFLWRWSQSNVHVQSIPGIHLAAWSLVGTPPVVVDEALEVDIGSFPVPNLNAFWNLVPEMKKAMVDGSPRSRRSSCAKRWNLGTEMHTNGTECMASGSEVPLSARLVAQRSGWGLYVRG